MQLAQFRQSLNQHPARYFLYGSDTPFVIWLQRSGDNIDWQEVNDKASIAALLTAAADVTAPDVHPNIANIYRKNVARFTEALDDPAGGREAAQALRSLIGEIVLTPGQKRGEVHAKLRGELLGILEFANAERNQRASYCMSAVVASPGFKPTR